MANSTQFFQSDIHIFDVSECSMIISSTSSKGNQCKWKFQDKFYKEDSLGYEGLSEVLCSQLAKQSSLREYGVVEYFPCLVVHNGRSYRGCYSYDYNPQHLEERTLYRVLTAHFNTDLQGVVNEYMKWDHSSSMTFYEFIRETLLLSYGYDTKEWLAQLLKFDWLVLNEDRHFNNISLFLNNNTLSPTPVYDNGAALLSDCNTFPLESDIEDLVPEVPAKPFQTSFKAQVNMVEQWSLKKLTLEDNITIDASELMKYYPETWILRALAVLKRQMHLLYPSTILSVNW